MRESNEGCATIPDSDETTFARLVEFLYTGDYNAPQPSRVGDIQPEDHRNQMEGEPAVASAIGNTYDEPTMPEPLPVASDVDVWGFATKNRRKQTSRTTKLPELVLKCGNNLTSTDVLGSASWIYRWGRLYSCLLLPRAALCLGGYVRYPNPEGACGAALKQSIPTLSQDSRIRRKHYRLDRVRLSAYSRKRLPVRHITRPLCASRCK